MSSNSEKDNTDNIIKNDLDYLSFNEQILDNIYAPKNVKINYLEIYKNQLNEMESLGFYDKNKNLQALILSKGDLNNAVSLLIE